jgi:hypothetical protein
MLLLKLFLCLFDVIMFDEKTIVVLKGILFSKPFRARYG